MESEEEDTSIIQPDADVIHALSRKYSQKSIEIAMQNSQSMGKLTPISESPDTTVDAKAGQVVRTDSQVSPSFSRITNVSHPENSSNSVQPNPPTRWYTRLASK
jgi:hypothetical protein